MADSDESDREFEKFLMASISGSDLTSGRADTGRESKKLAKSLDWNVSSSEDIESKPPSRFIKTATLTELDNILAETSAPKIATNEHASLEPQGILAALESQMLVGDSTTTEGYTESIERQEFANRLAQQNSALHSLGNNNIHDSPADRMGQTGTLEGLEELKEVVEEIRQKSSENSSSSKDLSGTNSQKHLNESSKFSEALQSEESQSENEESNNTGSIFSDASKSSMSEATATATEQTPTREEKSPEPESVSISEAYESDTLKEDESTDDESHAAEHPEMDLDSLQPVTVQNVSAPEASSPESSASVSEATTTEKFSAGKTVGIGVDLEPYVETKSDSEEQEQSFSQNIDDKIDDSIDDLLEKASIKNEEYSQAEIDSLEQTGNNNFKEEENEFIVPVCAPVEQAVQEQNKSLSSSVSVADIPPEDFGKTHEISLADSSLAELLNLTEETKSKKLAHTFDPAKITKKNETANLDATKTMYHKKPDFSHVKSSGYGTSYKPASSSRPRISPRLAAKVEAAKVEKRRKSAQLRMSQSQGFSSSGPIESVHEENIESLREQLELEQEKKREQLAKNQTVELNNYYLAEQEHLQEVKRANEYSQKIQFPRDDGDNVNKENEKLLSSYQLENEKLYLRNKELEQKVTALRTSTAHHGLQENETINRLENLLKKEETLRRNIEAGAREASRQRDDERRRVEEELRVTKNSLESENLIAKRLRDELYQKEKEITDLMKQLSVTSSSVNNASEKIEQLTMKKNDEVKQLNSELDKYKAELEFLARERSRNNASRKMSSFACQFDTDSNDGSSASNILADRKIQELKDEVNVLKREKRDLYSQLHELGEKAGRLDIAVESHEFEMEKLTQENAKIRLISERVPLLESKLARAEKNAVDAEQLEKRLQASIEDRNIFEERYLRSVESVKEAQAEIDARQQLVIDMHKQSQTFQRAANNFQKEKTAALVELENMRIELELVRQNSLPENLSHFAKKLSEMETANAQKEMRLRKIMQGEDSPMMRKEAMVDQTDTIINLKTTLNSKNNQFNKAQMEINSLRNELFRIRDQLSSSAADF